MLECGLHGADAADTEQRAAPVISAVHHRNAVTFLADQVFARHPHVFENHLRLDGQPYAELVLHAADGDARRIARHQDHAQIVAGVLAQIGAAEEHVDEVSGPSWPALPEAGRPAAP